MPFTEIYQIKFTNFEETEIIININDRLSWDADPGAEIAYYQLQAGSFKRSVIDNDENKETAIRAKNCTFTFISSDLYSASTFSTGEDDRWYVEVIIKALPHVLFRGHLIMNDITEPFLPRNSTIGNEVSLTAIDGLGPLDVIPLTTDSEVNPRGKHLIIKYIAWCLQKTSLELPIIVEMNLMEQGYPGECAWNKIYLEAKTFEKEIGESEDCYSVLEKILKSFGCYLTQVNGWWYIKRVDEFDTQPVYRYWFDFEGNFVNEQAPVYFNKTIGDLEVIYFSNEATDVKSERPFKWLKHTFNYDFPLEIIDNIDFSRGLIYTPLSMPPLTTFYHVDDWITMKVAGSTTHYTAEFLAYITRVFDADGYEQERFVTIAASAFNFVHLIQSNPIDLRVKDKFSLSVDTRYSGSIFNGAQDKAMKVKLTTVDNVIYTLRANVRGQTEPVWYQNDLEFVWLVYPIDTNETEWNSTSVDAPPIPQSGEITISLVNGFNQNVDKHFSNLQFSYKPYINGNYAKYDSQYFKITRSGNYKAKIDDPVAISDSPKPLFKGTMFKLVGNRYRLAERWYNGAVFHSGMPGYEYTHPLSHVVAFSSWNQYRNPNVIFQATLRGLGTNLLTDDLNVIPDLHHKWFILDNDNSSNNRLFIMTGFEQDFLTCEWTATLIEVFNVTTGKSYGDEKEFKYL